MTLIASLNNIAGPEKPFGERTTKRMRFGGDVGARYDRVWVETAIYRTDEGAEQIESSFSNTKRVQCFVDRQTGDILYSAGWKAPAKWKSGPATEFTTDESYEYARAVDEGLWGYKGDRAAWEAKRVLPYQPNGERNPNELRNCLPHRRHVMGAHDRGT